MDVVERGVHDLTDGRDMRADFNALGTQKQLAHGAGKHQRRSQAAGKVPAAAVIVAALIAHAASIVCVSRTWLLNQIAVILGTRVCVFNDTGNRRTRGFALKYAGKNLGKILFSARRGLAIFARCAAIHFGENECFIVWHAGRKTIEHTADAAAV